MALGRGGAAVALGGLAALGAIVAEEFHHNMRVAAPQMVRDLADNFAVRLVFGFDALAEKLRAWDAGLDDRVVEALKLRVARAQLGHLGPGFRLRLVRATREDWALELEATRVGVPDCTSFVLSLDEYVATQEALDYQPPEVMAARSAVSTGSLPSRWPALLRDFNTCAWKSPCARRTRWRPIPRPTTVPRTELACRALFRHPIAARDLVGRG